MLFPFQKPQNVTPLIMGPEVSTARRVVNLEISVAANWHTDVDGTQQTPFFLVLQPNSNLLTPYFTNLHILIMGNCGVPSLGIRQSQDFCNKYRSPVRVLFSLTSKCFKFFMTQSLEKPWWGEQMINVYMRFSNGFWLPENAPNHKSVESRPCIYPWCLKIISPIRDQVAKALFSFPVRVLFLTAVLCSNTPKVLKFLGL